MPRRNRRWRHTPPAPDTHLRESELSTDQMARSLIDRGLADPIILGSRPAWKRRQQWEDGE